MKNTTSEDNLGLLHEFHTFHAWPQEEQIRERLKVYHSQIDGITPFFQEVLTEVDGTGKPDEVFGLIAEDLDKL